MITGSETTHLVGRPMPVAYEGKLPVIPAQDVMALGLREDQVVRPLVAVQSEALKLVLQGKPFDPPAGMRLVAGDTPLMRVHILANGSAVLRPAEAQAQASGQTAPARLDRLLLLPNGLQTLLSALQPGRLLQMLAPMQSALPQVGPLAKLIQRARPSMEGMDGDTLKRAMLSSGFLSETLLAQKSAEPTDLKLLLRQMLHRMMQDPAQEESTRKLSELVDEMEAFQLQTLQVDSGRTAPVHVVLSFHNAPPIEMRIQQEREGRDLQNTAWDVDLFTQSEEWGGIWLRTRVMGEDRIGLTMWAERDEVSALASQRGYLLRDALRDAQLSLVDFKVIHGARPDRAPPPAAPGGAGRLIDCEA